MTMDVQTQEAQAVAPMIQIENEPTLSKDDPIALANQYGAHNYHPLPVAIVRGEGVHVWDSEGRKYIDMLSAYSALNQGHCHPKIVDALITQARKLTLTSRAFHNDQMGPFLKEVCELTGYENGLLMNSGAEAVETAIKCARRWGYKIKGVEKNKARIIVCDGNFHGRTTTIVGFSADEFYKDGFGPFPPGFDLIPYGDVEALEAAITPETVAFLVEPIQGEAGIVIPPEGYLREAARLCAKNNVLLVVDEIQTGFGRTGALFAQDHEGVKGDIVIIGKALGGGVYPVSGILASRLVMSVFEPGNHGSKFGGNPLASAVGRAALRVLVDEGLVERSRTLGERFLKRLRAVKTSKVAEIRGKGLFVGIELTEAVGPARPFCEALKAKGLLCKETHEHVIRLAPPLVISEEILDEAAGFVTSVLAD